MKTFENGFYAGISNKDYHSTDHISSSVLKIACQSMQKYKALKDGIIKFTPTDSMGLGIAVHAYVLEPERFNEEVAVMPELNIRTKKGKLERESFSKENQGKTIITKEQNNIAQEMAGAVIGHSEARNILSCKGNAYENSGFYTDTASGVECKYRPDIRNDLFIADLKTTIDASKNGFSRSIHKYGYHISASHYLEGERNLHKVSHNQFIFIAVENKPPYQVAVYTLDNDSLEFGDRERARGLSAIKKANETGDYPLLNDGIACDIGAPYWAFNTGE